MGLLGDIYSAIDTKKRQVKGLLGDFGGTVDMGVRRFREDQQNLQNLFANAYPMAGDKTVLNSPQQIAQFQREAADKAGEMGLAGATVWHGSPHKFDKFDSSKIGTGEGHQQQGIGAYLAESEKVGQKYADKESWKRGMDSGYLYKVDIPDDAISNMANHEDTFSNQPASVKAAVSSMFGPDELSALKGYHGWENLDDAPFGAVLNSLEIARGNNRNAVSESLKKAGVPGIRYLDGGSRSAGGGTSNFVVFPGNEGLLSILERNGLPLK